MSSIRFMGLPENVKAACQRKLSMSGAAICEVAEAICPWDTGMMATHFWYKTGDGYVTVGNAMPYSGFVEFGHGTVPPNPVIRTALVMAELDLIWQGDWGTLVPDKVAVALVAARRKGRFIRGQLLRASQLERKEWTEAMPQVAPEALTKKERKLMAERHRLKLLQKKG